MDDLDFSRLSDDAAEWLTGESPERDFVAELEETKRQMLECRTHNCSYGYPPHIDLPEEPTRADAIFGTTKCLVNFRGRVVSGYGRITSE